MRAADAAASPAPRAQPGGRERDARRDGRRAGTARTSGALRADRTEPARDARRARDGGRADDAEPAPHDRVAPRRRAPPARRCRSRGSRRCTAGPVAGRARRPSTSTRTAALEHRRREIDELRVEPERVDRVAAVERGARRNAVDAARRRRASIAVDLQRSIARRAQRRASICAWRSCDLLPARGDRDRRRPTRTARASTSCVGASCASPSASTRAARRRRCGRDGAAR